jgi:hypothetical protein
VQEIIMNATDNGSSHPARKARLAGMAGLIAAGAVAGGVLASTAGASAATTSSTSAAPSTSSTAAPANPAAPSSQSSTPVRSDEKAVTDAVAATLKAKALAAVPGGTVYRVETDAGDGTYEAHMTKADGSLVTVKFDANLNVKSVESGMGQGDPAPAGAPGGGAPGAVA